MITLTTNTGIDKIVVPIAPIPAIPNSVAKLATDSDVSLSSL